MLDLKKITFGFEQTFTIPEWWSESGFTHVSDTPLKRQMMEELAKELAKTLKGTQKETLDIYKHIQFEVFDEKKNPSFVVTMDPGSIEVKSPPVHFEGIERLFTPLFEAAKNTGLVPYRNWWYGVKGGTEGGCHINIGGKTPEENIFMENPYLLLKYFALLHNNPCLHYPFMGIDVGPGGNAQRMDEKGDFDKIKKAFSNAYTLETKGELDFKKLLDLFKDTTLLTEKSSAPSLAKLSPPNFVLEDRAQESLRSATEIKLICDLKLSLIKIANEQTEEISLQDFPKLHQEMLTSYKLWEDFQFFCNKYNLNPVPYQAFFERQFPTLAQGEFAPKKFSFKIGRRPRKVLSEEKRNGIVVSKKIDTSYKRFEVSFSLSQEEIDFFGIDINAQGIEHISPLFFHQGYLNFNESGKVFYLYFDIKEDEENPLCEIVFKNISLDKIIETRRFHLKSMNWIE